MLNATAVRTVITHLACGEGEEAHLYLRHFAAPVRARIVEEVRTRVKPEALAIFEVVAPWLAGEAAGDDTPERIRLALREAGAAGLNLTELARRIRRIRPDVMAVALDGLVEAREVVFERETTGGRVANRYRLEEFADGIKAANEMDDPFADRSHRA